MLRAGVLVFGGVMLAAAALGALAGCRPAATIPLAIGGGDFCRRSGKPFFVPSKIT